jgi:hypothetical protein
VGFLLRCATTEDRGRTAGGPREVHTGTRRTVTGAKAAAAVKAAGAPIRAPRLRGSYADAKGRPRYAQSVPTRDIFERHLDQARTRPPLTSASHCPSRSVTLSGQRTNVALTVTRVFDASIRTVCILI